MSAPVPNAATRLMLGTVQFGVDYGISNRLGQTSPEEANAILTLAEENHVHFVDTAHAYGSSESCLGALSARHAGLEIVTKTPDLTDCGPTGFARYLQESLKRLRRDSVYGLLLHNADNLLGPHGDAIYREMRSAKECGLAKKIGISVYTAAQIDELPAKFALDLVQVPLNALDQRLLHSGTLNRLKERNTEVHARSAFLQGLLLMDPADLGDYFDPVREKITGLRAATAGLSLPGALLRFVAAMPEVDKVVVGVNDASQLRELLDGYSQGGDLDFRDFAIDDESILNPSRWPNGASSRRA